MIKRGTGFIPDRLQHVVEDREVRPLFDRAGVSRLVGVDQSFARSRDWRHLIDQVQDQSTTSSCVSQFVSSGVFLAGAAQNNPIPRPSALWAYAVGRWSDQRDELVDNGCRPRDMLAALAIHGLISAERWPFAVADVNVGPPIDADISAADALLTDWYAVAEGPDAPDQNRAALDKGHFPGIAIDVHEGFFDYQGGIYDEPEGELKGLHMVTCVGYRPGSILILNSWGDGWGDQGCCWLSDRFVASHYAKQGVAIAAAPAALAAA